jgi:hypothetical protein
VRRTDAGTLDCWQRSKALITLVHVITNLALSALAFACELQANLDQINRMLRK